MSPALFAMVDLVLVGAVLEAEDASNDAAFHPLAHFTLAMGQVDDAIQALGWWRSCWPLVTP